MLSLAAKVLAFDRAFPPSLPSATAAGFFRFLLMRQPYCNRLVVSRRFLKINVALIATAWYLHRTVKTIQTQNMKTETIDLSETCTVVVPPNIHAMITGVSTAKIFPSGVVQLFYLDGNSESAHLTVEQLTAGRESFFSLVSAVQSMRGPTTR